MSDDLSYFGSRLSLIVSSNNRTHDSSVGQQQTYCRYEIHDKDDGFIKTVAQCRKTQRFVSNDGFVM